MSEKTPFAYDNVIYPNYLHTQTHPDRLATMSSFLGMNPKPVEHCRVLELGCGTGSSLLSFANDLRESEFIGIDLSEKQIEIGNRAVREVGLTNLKLLHGDIMEINREKFGEFDYIIAHGLYSWVPSFVRDQILHICSEMIAEQGVAFISYNAYPGCHERQMVREMMLYHTKNINDPREKIERSMGLLKFISEASREEKLYKSVLQYEFEQLENRSVENIYHDDLADVNHPVYFYEFINHARQHNLQFVSEVEYFNSKLNSKEILEALEKISKDVIDLEQYLDFIKGRRFRQTLLCRQDVKLNKKPDQQVLRRVRLASPVRAESAKPELATDKHEKFLGDEDAKIEIDHPLTKAALMHLGKIWTRSTTYEELIASAVKMLSEETGKQFEITERDEEILIEILFSLFCSGLLRLNVHEPNYTIEVSDYPTVSPVARWQLINSDSISTLLCTSVVITDSLGKELVRLLDGTRNHEQLSQDLAAFIKSGAFEQTPEIKENILKNLPEQLENNLASFARMGLFIA